MANITKEERERRAAEAAKNTQSQQQSPPEQPEANEGENETPPPAPEETDPNALTEAEKEAMTGTSPAPKAAPAKPGIQPSPFDVDETTIKHFKASEMEKQKKLSLEAIEQAVRDACKSTEDRIRKDPVVLALANDPGDVEKRLAFLRKFGPSNVKPPRPPRTAYGIKDPDLMRWMATYEPDEFIKHHGEGRSVLAKELLAGIRRQAGHNKTTAAA